MSKSLVLILNDGKEFTSKIHQTDFLYQKVIMVFTVGSDDYTSITVDTMLTEDRR